MAARVAAAHPEPGWSLVCNGVVLFDDAGVLLPDGHTVAPRSQAKVLAFPTVEKCLLNPT